MQTTTYTTTTTNAIKPTLNNDDNTQPQKYDNCHKRAQEQTARATTSIPTCKPTRTTKTIHKQQQHQQQQIHTTNRSKNNNAKHKCRRQTHAAPTSNNRIDNIHHAQPAIATAPTTTITHNSHKNDNVNLK